MILLLDVDQCWIRLLMLLCLDMNTSCYNVWIRLFYAFVTMYWLEVTPWNELIKRKLQHKRWIYSISKKMNYMTQQVSPECLWSPNCFEPLPIISLLICDSCFVFLSNNVRIELLISFIFVLLMFFLWKTNLILISYTIARINYCKS